MTLSGDQNESAIIDIKNSYDAHGGNTTKNGETIDTTFKSGNARSSIEDCQKTTTIRSQKSAGGSVASRKSHSIRSLRSHQRSKRASEMQTNDFYVVGSLDTINVNYKVDVERQRIQPKPMLR